MAKFSLRILLLFATSAGLVSLPAELQAQDSGAASGAGWVNNYQQARSEQLIDEGLRLLEEGDYPAAEQRFSDAVQVTKVNSGLHTKTQLPALALLIETQIALRKWDAADQQFAYFESLNARIYSDNFYDYLAGTATLSRLLLSASADTVNPTSARYLIAARNLSWRTVSAIESTLGEHSLELAPWLYNIVLVHYYQSALTKRRGLTSYDYKTDTSDIVAGWSLRRNEYLRISHAVGKELLERIRALYNQAEPKQPETDALLTVHLGDWEMLFGRNSEALEYYTTAYEKFVAAGIDSAAVDAFFGKPTVLPANRLITSLESAQQEPDRDSLRFIAWSPNYLAAAVPLSQFENRTFQHPEYKATVRFNLTPLNSDGNTQLILVLNSLQVISTNPDSEHVKDLVRDEVSMLQFRPSIIDGKLVSRENIEMEYLFSPQLGPVALTDID